MNLNDLTVFISQDESETLEFKRTTSQLKAACETLCAFLNHHGGVVLVGVDNHGQLIGQSVTDNTKQEIAHELRKIQPAVAIEVSYIPLANAKIIIVMRAPTGQHQPYIYDDRPYQRVQSTTARMSQHHYEQLLVKRGYLNYMWEEYIVDDYDISCLDVTEIKHLVEQAVNANRMPQDAINEPIQNVLEQMNLVKEGNLTYAALVLFAKQPLPKFSHCVIRLARFRGTDKLGDFIDNQQFYGNAFQILSTAQDFVRRHLPIASWFQSGSFQRVDKPALPPLAIREALINAICHRDYSNQMGSIAVAIFDDRMEIWNNGLLPSTLTIDDLKKNHRSYPRNQLIARAFYVRGFIETFGTGTTKMVNLCKAHGLTEPLFMQESGGLKIEFKFEYPISSFVPVRFAQDAAINLVSERQQTILTLLAGGKTLKAKEILEKLALPIAERTLRDDLAKLKKLNLIQSTGHAKTALWGIVNK